VGHLVAIINHAEEDKECSLSCLYAWFSAVI